MQYLGIVLEKIKRDIDESLESITHESPRIKQFHEKLKLQPIPSMQK